MPLYAVTLLSCATSEAVESLAGQHHEYLSELHSCGKLRLAGDFKNGDGFLQILSVADRLEAESVVRTNPLIEAGLVSWMLREWSETEL